LKRKKGMDKAVDTILTREWTASPSGEEHAQRLAEKEGGGKEAGVADRVESRGGVHGSVRGVGPEGREHPCGGALLLRYKEWLCFYLDREIKCTEAVRTAVS